MQRPNSKALRIGRWSERGRPYLVTFTTHHRRALFAAWDAASVAARCLGSDGTWADATLHAWVLMPDHWHGLVAPGDARDLSSAVARAKAMTTIELRKECGLRRPVWSTSFHDRAMRRDDDLRTAAKYLVANPIRAGLVERVGDYPFWNAVWLADGARA